MIFTDPFFLFVFLPVVCAIFYLVTPRLGPTGGLGVILAASLAFYAPWGVWMLSVLLTSITVNYAIARMLFVLSDSAGRARRTLFIAGEAFNFGALIWFKYHFIQRLLAGLGGSPLGADALIIPIGISFYTFHQAAFLADTYNREASTVVYLGGHVGLAKIVEGFVRYAAFVAFFPQLVIGPITYLKEFQPQVLRATFGRLRQTDLAVGVMLIAIGMFKKVVIADNLAPFADGLFAQAADRAPIHVVAGWMGVLSYYAQLYFDFSGYSDMALGIARLFGIRFPINFFSPLKAVGIIDFYRRWHMTLTRVISRFLYTPLSLHGTRFAIVHRLPVPVRLLAGVWLPLLVNFEVIALWHGASLTFIVFGLIHGTWYVIETQARGTAAWKTWRKSTPDWLRTWCGRAIFVVPMCLTFALFRSQDLGAAWHLTQSLFGFNLRAPKPFLLSDAAPMVAFALGVIYLLPNSVELLQSWRPGLMTYDNESYRIPWLPLRWRPTWGWSAVMLGLIVGSMYYAYRQPPFLYMGF